MERSVFRQACRGALAALLLPLAALAAPGDALGPEFRINTPGTPDGIFGGTVARNGPGLIVASWDGYGPQGYGLYVRRLDAGGAPLAAEQLVPGASNQASGETIAINDSGAFVLVWNETGAPGKAQVVARRYDAAGNAVGPLMAISGIEAKASHGGGSAAILPNGDFVVAWRRKVDEVIPDYNPQLLGLSSPYNISSSQIMLRRYRADGTPLGVATRVAAALRTFSWYTGLGSGRYLSGPAVALLPDGQALLSWSSQPFKAGAEIHLQRVAADGKVVGKPTVVVKDGGGDTTRLGVDAQGNAVVAWVSNSNAVQLRRYDAAGNPRGEVQVAHAPVAEYGSGPSLAVAPGGSFVLGWTRTLPGTQWPSYRDAQMRRFGANGNPLAPEFRVNSHTQGDHGMADVAVDGLGNPVALLREGDAPPLRGYYLKMYQGP